MRLCIPKSLCLSLQCNPLPKSQFLVFFLIFHTDPEKPCLVPALDGTKQGLCWEPSTGNPGDSQDKRDGGGKGEGRPPSVFGSH